MTLIKYTISLLALILLIPVGMTNTFAQGGPGEDDFTENIGHVGVVNELAALNSVLDDYLDELKVEQDIENIEYLDTAVTRLEIAKAMMQVSKNSTDIAIQYQGLTVQELLGLLDQTYGPEDHPATNSNDSSKHINIGSSTDYSTIDGVYFVSHSTPQVDVLKHNNHYQTQYDCVDRRTITSSSLSVLTSYTDGTAIITGTFDYPEDLDKNIRERRSNQCLNFEHVETIKRHDVLVALIPGNQVPAQVCTLIERNPNGIEIVRCNAFGPDRITLVTTHNTYDSSSRTTQLGSTLVSVLTS